MRRRAAPSFDDEPTAADEPNSGAADAAATPPLAKRSRMAHWPAADPPAHGLMLGPQYFRGPFTDADVEIWVSGGPEQPFSSHHLPPAQQLALGRRHRRHPTPPPRLPPAAAAPSNNDSPPSPTFLPPASIATVYRAPAEIVPVHLVVIASASPYFATLLSGRWSSLAGAPGGATSSAPPPPAFSSPSLSAFSSSSSLSLFGGGVGFGGGDFVGNRRTVRVVVQDEKDVPAAVVMLRSLYTGRVTASDWSGGGGGGDDATATAATATAAATEPPPPPGAAWQDLALRVLRLADQYQVGAALAAAARGLLAVPPRALSPRTARALLALPETLAAVAAVAPVAAHALEAAWLRFRDLEAVLSRPRLLREWRALPRVAVQRVLSDSGALARGEDAVLAAADAWARGPAGRAAGPAARRALARCVRLPLLTGGFLRAAARRCAWFRNGCMPIQHLELLAEYCGADAPPPPPPPPQPADLMLRPTTPQQQQQQQEEAGGWGGGSGGGGGGDGAMRRPAFVTRAAPLLSPGAQHHWDEGEPRARAAGHPAPAPAACPASRRLAAIARWAWLSRQPADWTAPPQLLEQAATAALAAALQPRLILPPAPRRAATAPPTVAGTPMATTTTTELHPATAEALAATMGARQAPVGGGDGGATTLAPREPVAPPRPRAAVDGGGGQDEDDDDDYLPTAMFPQDWDIDREEEEEEDVDDRGRIRWVNAALRLVEARDRQEQRRQPQQPQLPQPPQHGGIGLLGADERDPRVLPPEVAAAAAAAAEKAPWAYVLRACYNWCEPESPALVVSSESDSDDDDDDFGHDGGVPQGTQRRREQWRARAGLGGSGGGGRGRGPPAGLAEATFTMGDLRRAHAAAAATAASPQGGGGDKEGLVVRELDGPGCAREVRAAGHVWRVAPVVRMAAPAPSASSSAAGAEAAAEACSAPWGLAVRFACLPLLGEEVWASLGDNADDDMDEDRTDEEEGEGGEDEDGGEDCDDEEDGGGAAAGPPWWRQQQQQLCQLESTRRLVLLDAIGRVKSSFAELHARRTSRPRGSSSGGGGGSAAAAAAAAGPGGSSSSGGALGDAEDWLVDGAFVSFDLATRKGVVLDVPGPELRGPTVAGPFVMRGRLQSRRRPRPRREGDGSGGGAGGLLAATLDGCGRPLVLQPAPTAPSSPLRARWLDAPAFLVNPLIADDSGAALQLHRGRVCSVARPSAPRALGPGGARLPALPLRGWDPALWAAATDGTGAVRVRWTSLSMGLDLGML